GHTGAGRPGRAEDRVREALALAERTGDGNAFGLWFGPTNVGAWRVWLAVEAGGGDVAAELAATVNQALLPPSRRAQLLVDVGRGLARERNQHHEAIRMLLRAETLAPQFVHAAPAARDAIPSLLSATGGTDLRGLARRAGVA